MAHTISVRRTKETLRVGGHLGLMEFRRLLAALYDATVRKGFRDLTLDLSHLEQAFAGPMLALLAVCVRLREESDVEFRVIPPADRDLQRLFFNANWSFLLDPEHFGPSSFKGFTQVPAFRFRTPAEQKQAVDKIIDALLSSLGDLSRADLGAIEWAVYEICDNVLTHSESPVGGLIQFANMKRSGRVEFTVADPGVGIPASIRLGHPTLRTDQEALIEAVQEGVTRDSKIGQGNGLFGTYEIAQVGSGYLHIHSGYGRLDYQKDLRARGETIPFKGTLVVAALDVTDTDALGEALRFKGRRYEPFDYIEARYEHPRDDVLVVTLADEVDSFGSRRAGIPLRNKLSNLVRMNPDYLVVVDFTDVPIVSSSFADEVLGKLYVELGPERFNEAIQLRNMARSIEPLIERAIRQRVQQEAED